MNYSESYSEFKCYNWWSLIFHCLINGFMNKQIHSNIAKSRPDMHPQFIHSFSHSFTIYWSDPTLNDRLNKIHILCPYGIHKSIWKQTLTLFHDNFVLWLIHLITIHQNCVCIHWNRFSVIYSIYFSKYFIICMKKLNLKIMIIKYLLFCYS